MLSSFASCTPTAGGCLNTWNRHQLACPFPHWAHAHLHPHLGAVMPMGETYHKQYESLPPPSVWEQSHSPLLCRVAPTGKERDRWSCTIRPHIAHALRVGLRGGTIGFMLMVVDFSSMYLYINNNLKFYYLLKIEILNAQSNVNVELWINLELSIVVLLGLEIEVPTLYSALYLCRSAI